jgi:hypothetical protein
MLRVQGFSLRQPHLFAVLIERLFAKRRNAPTVLTPELIKSIATRNMTN